MNIEIEHVAGGRPSWLADLGHDAADGTAHRVSELLPAGYDVYLRLFHPFLPWDADPYTTDASERRTWRSLAAEVGVTFDGRLQWRSLEPAVPIIEGGGRRYGVAVGELDPVIRTRLFSLLGAYTAPQSTCFFYGLSAQVVGRESVLLRAPLASVEEVIVRARAERLAGESPELVWPEDRSWIICTDHDLDSSYIAANHALAATLAADSQLEILKVSRDTRIDSRADDPTTGD